MFISVYVQYSEEVAQTSACPGGAFLLAVPSEEGRRDCGSVGPPSIAGGPLMFRGLEGGG